MRHLELGWVLLYFTSAASTSFIEDTCHCVTDYWTTLSCVLNITGTRDSSSYTLNFSGCLTDRTTLFTCELVQSHGEYSCTQQVPEECLSTEASLTIDVQHNVSKVRVHDIFEPSQCIKTRAPLAPVLTQTANLWNITWTTGYEEHWSLNGALEFELLLQSTSDLCFSDKCKSYHLNSQTPYLCVEKSKLEPGSLQCAQVRSKPSHEDYRGMWSEWSPQTCWKMEQHSGPKGMLVISVLCALLLAALSISTTRYYKKKMKTHIPSPAPFFKPLFHQYDGCLKNWTSAHCTFVFEDILTTEIVIVEFIKKEPEALQDFQSPTVPLADSSYVGLADLESPSLLTAMCPAQSSSTSYTQLPAFLWGRSRSAEACEASVCQNVRM